VTANTPKSRKAKGRNLQQEVKALIESINPELLPGDVRSTSMGASGVDLLLSPRAKELFPVSVECKAVETFHVWSTWAQTVEHEKKENDFTIPAVFFRKSRHELLALIRGKTLIELIRYAVKGGYCVENRSN